MDFLFGKRGTERGWCSTVSCSPPTLMVWLLQWKSGRKEEVSRNGVSSIQDEVKVHKKEERDDTLFPLMPTKSFWGGEGGWGFFCWFGFFLLHSKHGWHFNSKGTTINSNNTYISFLGSFRFFLENILENKWSLCTCKDMFWSHVIWCKMVSEG